MLGTGREHEQGFTLIELMVATVVIVSATLFSLLFLLAPTDYNERNKESERRAEIAYIAQGITKYATDTGQLPPDMPSVLTAIGSYEDNYNLCTFLVPAYLKDIPLDPAGGLKVAPRDSTSEHCNDADIRYGTGYAIAKDKNGRVTITAPLAEAEESPAIEITIKPLP